MEVMPEDNIMRIWMSARDVLIVMMSQASTDSSKNIVISLSPVGFTRSRFWVEYIPARHKIQISATGSTLPADI